MGRPLRVEYAGALYHITSRGNERKKIFLDDGDRKKFLEILEDYYDRYGILIHGYVLMDNHLILETPKGNLLKVMHVMDLFGVRLAIFEFGLFENCNLKLQHCKPDPTCLNNIQPWTGC
jgi:hypothetical protein